MNSRRSHAIPVDAETAGRNPGRTNRAQWGEGIRVLSVFVLVLTNLLVFQMIYYSFVNIKGDMDSPSAYLPPTKSTSLSLRSQTILSIPEGGAIALPSIRLHEDTISRGDYGGAGDEKHLGGFTDFDLHGVSPSVWKFMLEYGGVKSLLDVGCGRGISTSWFDIHGVETVCVEGSHDAVINTMIPGVAENPSKLVEHDFSRGPWWPSKTVDAIWCVEFLEHVGRNYHKNYIPAFRKAALIFATHSHWGGWHHVEVHRNEWWINKLVSYGFVYSDSLTEMVRQKAKEEQARNIESPTGESYNAQHVWLTMQVFINPSVAVLPEHEHLLAEHGCFEHRQKPNVECEGVAVSSLPDSFKPLEVKDEVTHEWVDWVRRHIKAKNETKRKK